MKLIPMTDFVQIRNLKSNSTNEAIKNAFNEIQLYASFLDQELKMEMLASVNGSDEKLILFKGFTVSKDENDLIFKCKDFEFRYDAENGMYQSYLCEDMYMGTVEDLMRYAGCFLVDMELTDVALEQLK